MWNSDTVQDAKDRYEFIMVVPGHISRIYIQDSIPLWRSDPDIMFHTGYRIAGHRTNIYSTLTNAGVDLNIIDNVMETMITVKNYQNTMAEIYNQEWKDQQAWINSFNPTPTLASAAPSLYVPLPALPSTSPMFSSASPFAPSTFAPASPFAPSTFSPASPFSQLPSTFPPLSSVSPSSPRSPVFPAAVGNPRSPTFAPPTTSLFSPLPSTFPSLPQLPPLPNLPNFSLPGQNTLVALASNPKAVPTVAEVERALVSAPTQITYERETWQGPPSPSNPRPGFAPGNVVAIIYGNGRDFDYKFAYIASMTPSGGLRVFYIPTRHVNVEDATYHKTQIIPDVNQLRQTGFEGHETFRWSKKKGYRDPDIPQYMTGSKVDKYYQLPYYRSSPKYI